MVRTYTGTQTFTRINLLKFQVRSVLRRLTDISPEALERLVDGLEKRLVRSFMVYAFDSSKLCRAEIKLDRDWDEHEAQLAIGRTTISIGKGWNDNTRSEERRVGKEC